MGAARTRLRVGDNLPNLSEDVPICFGSDGLPGREPRTLFELANDLAIRSGLAEPPLDDRLSLHMTRLLNHMGQLVRQQPLTA